MSNQIDLEFIQRAKELMTPYVKETREKIRNRVNKWNEENRETLRKCQKDYEKTEKGKVAVKKSWKKRRVGLKKAAEGLSLEERKKIKKFYAETPLGFVVDHIIPISKGGKHVLSNLQYLSRIENSKKGCKIINEH